jgi:hypothetical protein
MTEERKADMEAALAELEFEINLAIQERRVPDNGFDWQETFTGPDGEPWIALLTIGKVEKSL